MALVDQYGHPIDLGLLAEPQTADTAWLQREFETHPARGMTPARLAAVLLRAEQGDWMGQLDLADDIEERDGHAYAELSKRKGAIAALEWDVVEPEAATVTEKAHTEQLREWMRALPDFEDVLLEMMDGVLKVLSAHAIAWKPEGRVRLPQLTATPARWFVPDATRNALLLRSATQMAPAAEGLASVMGEPLRPLAWMCHVPRSRNGYLARSALVRVLAWPYLFKHYAIRDLAELLEIHGLPMRLGVYPAGATREEKATLLRAVTDIGHNAAGIIPQGMKVDFQAAADGNHAPFESMIRYMDALESKVILGQTLSASEGQNGTQALGNVHERVKLGIRATDARQVEGTVTNQLLVPMGIINIPGFNPRRPPRFKLDISEPEDLKQFAEALPALEKLGMQIPVDWAHEKLRIPKPEAGQEVLRSVAPPPALGGDGTGSGEDVADETAPGRAEGKGSQPKRKPARAAALAGQVAPAQARDAIDDLVAEQAAQWQPLLGPMVRPLLAELDRAVLAGETLQAFAARLPQLVARMDPTPLADDLARASFAARLAGEADIDLSGQEA